MGSMSGGGGRASAAGAGGRTGSHRGDRELGDSDLADGLSASIVIPTWNGARFLPTCLDSLRAQAGRDFEIIVVDNGSTDDTAEVLARYPEVRVVALPVNLGFAAGVNAGIAAAAADVVVLLNNDTEADPAWLGALLSGLDAAPGAGMAASKLRLFDQRDRLHNTGDCVDLAGWPSNRGAWELDDGQWDGDRQVFGPCAAAAAYRRPLLEAVGVFEERFGSYLEDVDLAWRARLAGWDCVYVPDAVVYHHVSATGGGPIASYLVARNRFWLLARNYPLRLLGRHAGRVAAAHWRAVSDAVRAWRGAAARATLRGTAVGLLTWPAMLPARRRIQASRTLDDAELELLLRAASSGPRHGPEQNRGELR
jgi:GT2 family glycosyltransferase